MADNKICAENDNDGGSKSDTGRIEEILKQKVSLDTDVMDFFLIAGWDYWESPIYEDVDKETKRLLRKYVNDLRQKLAKRQKGVETRFQRCCLYHIGGGGYCNNEFKTLSELKAIIETDGLRWRNVGYKSLTYFNETLKKHGINAFRVGGRYSSANILKRYGLELSKK